MARDAHLAFRLALGLAALGYERMIAELHAAAPAPAPALPDEHPRHAVIGGLVVTASALASALRRARARLPAPPRRIVRALASWTEIGRREEAAGRALAAAVVARVNGEFMDRMSESAELQHLVEEHSAGLTRAMLDELRERSARADDRLEHLVRPRRKGH